MHEDKDNFMDKKVKEPDYRKSHIKRSYLPLTAALMMKLALESIRLLLICRATRDKTHKDARLEELHNYSESMKPALLNQFKNMPSKPKLTVMRK